jgi:uncharacterized protein YgbK (DUF1537 family)
MAVSYEKIIQGLPPVPEEDFLAAVRQELEDSPSVTVVLDDDPTGTQTVHKVAVLTEWSVPLLKQEFERRPKVFFVLTNSRALPEPEAVALNREIARNLQEAARQAGVSFIIVSRSDSTLRGHFPAEPQALVETLGWQDAVWVLAPALFEAGRITVHDTHLVQEGGQLIPAGQTPFARDPAFGYTNSELPRWVAEKTRGRIPARQVQSFSVEKIRTASVETLAGEMGQLPAGTVCVLNAVVYADLEKAALALRKAEKAGKRFLYRSAASLARALCGMAASPLLQVEDLPGAGPHGGLVVVGSYVKKSSAQLANLQQNRTLLFREVPVADLLGAGAGAVISTIAAEATGFLAEGQTVALYTSRKLEAGTSPAASLEIGHTVSQGLVQITRQIGVRPAFIAAKGGITSSDLATGALQIKRALVAGQIHPGVPVWITGPESLFPGIPYVVFPGNVGTDTALADVVEKLVQGRQAGQSDAATPSRTTP